MQDCCFLVINLIRQAGGQVKGQVKNKSLTNGKGTSYNKLNLDILQLVHEGDKSSGDIVKALGLNNLSGALKLNIELLRINSKIAYLYPDTPRSSKQKYKITNKGKILLVQWMKQKND